MLSSSRIICRKCGKKLTYENKVIPVVLIWVLDRPKCAVNVKFTKHHGYWSVDGEQCVNRDSVSLEFLL